LLREAGGGGSRYEAAAFLVRFPGGRVGLVFWPRSESADEAQWIGRYPAGTLAIAHTHPGWMPRPSRVDVGTAQNANLPVYVVTHRRISKTAGGIVMTVAEGEWE
jgi:hypothetical protein